MIRDFLLDAIIDLSNGNFFAMGNRDIDSIVWENKDFIPPTSEEILKRAKEIEEEYKNSLYVELRRSEYPDFREYLDGIVKGDQEQIDSYIAKCLAVKEKYPKPV